MATVSASIDIRATPAEILDVIADLTDYPQWSSVHRRATIEQSYPDGRPQRATMAVAAVGLTDEQVLDYTWTDDGVSWSLVKAGQQKHQHGSYTITHGAGGVSHVRYDLSIDPLIPMPGLIVRQVMKKAVTAATEGLKKHIESSR
jgi:hypothetical protein